MGLLHGAMSSIPASGSIAAWPERSVDRVETGKKWMVS